MTDHIKIARAVFDAFQTNDIEAVSRLCADNFQGSQNGNPGMDRASLIGFLGAVHAKVNDFRYEDIVCSATPDGFVEEHTVKGTLPDGEQFSLRLCVIGSITNGKVTQLREYLDTVGAAGLAKALAA